MKLTLDPMPARRAGAAGKVNEFFANRYPIVAQRALAHRRKAEQAAGVLAGGKATAGFAAEASMRGMTIADFASLVASKAGADALDDMELRRQTALLAIDAAQTPAELDAILAGLK